MLMEPEQASEGSWQAIQLSAIQQLIRTHGSYKLNSAETHFLAPV